MSPLFPMSQNKEKEAEKAKERQTKAELKSAYTQGGSGEEAFFKKVNDKEAEHKETARKTIKDNENVNMAKAAFG
jgi:hypothetical protein